MPALVLPDGLKPRGLGMQPEEIAFDPPLPPSYLLQPAPPPYDKPVYGADWTGLKPFQVVILKTTLLLLENTAQLLSMCITTADAAAAAAAAFAAVEVETKAAK